MKYTLANLALLFQLVAAGPSYPLLPRDCTANNCLRAIRGTQAGITRSASRLGDCASYLATTVIPPTPTQTVYVYTATFVGTADGPSDVVNPGGTTTTVIPTSIPDYAVSACNQPPLSSQYSSACLCDGATTTTSTVPTPSTTTVTISTASTTAPGVFPSGGLCAFDPPCYPALPDNPVFTDNAMTQEECASHCAGLTPPTSYYGLQAGDECFCSTTIPGNVIFAPGLCTTACVGDSSENCGGTWLINIFAAS